MIRKSRVIDLLLLINNFIGEKLLTGCNTLLFLRFKSRNSVITHFLNFFKSGKRLEVL